MSDTANATADPYLEITPADGDLQNVESVFRRLAAADHPLAAYLIGEGETVRYVLGVPGGDPESLRNLCRRLLPDTYSLTPTTHPLQDVEFDDTTTATALVGAPVRRRDWQTPLTPHQATTRDDTGVHSPLGDLVDHFASMNATCIYQAIIEPSDPWDHRLETRTFDLEHEDDTPGQKLTNLLTGLREPDSLLESTQARLESLTNKDARHPLAVTARITATGPDAEAALQGLDGVVAPISGEYYTIRTDPTRADPDTVDEFLSESTHQPPWTQQLKRRLPFTSNASPRIICDATTAPQFCLLDPESLTTTGSRVTTHQPADHTGQQRPTPDALHEYQASGLTLGHPQTSDNTTDPTPIAVPPRLQPMHVAWFGQTGAGKTTGLIRGMLDNHHATSGASVLIEGKGDGMPTDYLQSHFQKYGTLNDVYYLDCRTLLPALSVFDIRQDIEAGIDRTTAVIDRIDHYVDILEQLIGPDKYRDAIRSTDLVRYLLRACFDPVHGEDAFTHRAFLETITRMQTSQEAPAVSDPDLATALQGVTASHRDTFQNVMGGVKTRVEEIVTDQRLTTIFNHTPTDGEPHFEFDDLLNEDTILILDTGGLRQQSQRVLTLLLLAELWAALRRRSHHTTDNPPLVNLYLEEASDITASQILRDLLAKGRGYNVSVTIATQFPSQLEDSHGTRDEILNNISTIITGNVPDDQPLARRLATSTHTPREVANRLRALRRGEWLATLPAPFNADRPHPFKLNSTPIPPGHPDSTHPLTDHQHNEFEQEYAALTDRTADDIGLEFTDSQPTTVTTDDEEDAFVEIVSTTLPHTQRFPTCIDYDPKRHAIRCTRCDNHYDPSIQGVKRAIQCCHAITDVDRDNIPTVAINLKLSPDEIQAADYTPKQLAFLQIVHTAQHQRYTELEYNLLQDSMVRLREYVAIDANAIQQLVDDDLLRKDTDYPHRLYSVTAQGRREINEATREGLDHGDGHGDLGETSQHRMAVTTGQTYLDQEFVQDPENPATHSAAYYPLKDNKRLDAAALDDNGDVVVALEAERINNDTKEAVPADYDKMANCEPAEAIWIAMNRDGAHKILTALNNPKNGDPRVEKTYSQTTAPRRFKLNTPGATQMYTLSTIQNKLN